MRRDFQQIYFHTICAYPHMYMPHVHCISDKLHALSLQLSLTPTASTIHILTLFLYVYTYVYMTRQD